MKIYLAHPMTGLGFEEIVGYFRTMADSLKGYDVLYPMIAKGYLQNDKDFKPTGYVYPPSTDHAITKRDLWMVSQSDVILIDFSGVEKVSIGCVMELAWAHQLRKHAIIVLPEGNIHRHAFVLECADIVFETMYPAVEYLNKLSARQY